MYQMLEGAWSPPDFDKISGYDGLGLDGPAYFLETEGRLRSRFFRMARPEEATPVYDVVRGGQNKPTSLGPHPEGQPHPDWSPVWNP